MQQETSAFWPIYAGEDLDRRVTQVRKVFSPRQTNYISRRTLQRYDSIDEFYAAIANEVEVSKENNRGLTISVLDLDQLERHDSSGRSDSSLLAITDDAAFVDACLDNPTFTADEKEAYLTRLRSGLIDRDRVIAETWLSKRGRAQERPMRDRRRASSPRLSSLYTDKILCGTRSAVGTFEIGTGMICHVPIVDGRVRTEGRGYVFTGPKCRLRAGRYALRTKATAARGCFRLDVVAFGGTIKFFEIDFMSDLDLTHMVTVHTPIDFAEIRIEALSSDTGSLELHHLSLVASDVG